MSREKLIVEAILEWHKDNRRSFPWRDESDPYKVLVAEFFLQRTPAERVAKIFPEFIKEYPDPQVLAEANPSELMKKFSSLGLVKRIKWLIISMKVLCEHYNCKVPASKELLKKLPGIGEYTASAIMCFAFFIRTEIVDANIIRLYSRIFGWNINQIVEKSKMLLPQKKYVAYNEAILDFSAIICKKRPQCHNCIIINWCKWEKST